MSLLRKDLGNKLSRTVGTLEAVDILLFCRLMECVLVWTVTAGLRGKVFVSELPSGLSLPYVCVRSNRVW